MIRRAGGVLVLVGMLGGVLQAQTPAIDQAIVQLDQAIVALKAALTASTLCADPTASNVGQPLPCAYPPPPPPALVGATLDDFSAVRVNPGTGEPYIGIYAGEDSGQTWSISGGLLTVTGGNPGMYWHAASYPYVPPMGWAKNWIESGTWDATFNRMRFTFRCDRAIPFEPSGSGNIQVGTYIKTSTSDPANQGAHYYHLVDATIPANRWVWVDLNNQVQHQVGGNPNTNWPLITNYYDKLTRFYFDSQDDGWTGTRCEFQPLVFFKTTGEPDTLVSNLSRTYDGTRYQVSWSAPKNQVRVYEVRYRTSSMKTDGFTSGTDGGTVDATASAYTNIQWSSPAMAQPAGGLYVAVRPQGTTTFAETFVPNVP